MAAVGSVQETSRAGHLNPGTGVSLGEVFRNSWNGLELGKCAVGGIQPVGPDAAPLFVGKVQDIQGRIEAEMPGAVESIRLHLCRGVGSDLAGALVEPELVDPVGAVSSDMGNEGVPVGRVGLHGMGAGSRLEPYYRNPAHRPVFTDGVDANVGALVVGRQDVTALSVGANKSRIKL